MRAFCLGLLLFLGLLNMVEAQAETIGEMARIAGNRTNNVIGYGLVVGLPGTGDQTTEVPYTTQTITNMLRHMGINLPPAAFMQPNNDAAVMVTGSIPPDAKPGQHFTVTVSAVGNAQSLRGGVLLMTQLHAANGQVYAQAQGSVLVTGAAAIGAAALKVLNNPTVGQISSGAVVEMATPQVDPPGPVILLLRRPGYVAAARAVESINAVFPGTAAAMGSANIAVQAPAAQNARVSFIAALEQIPVHTPAPEPVVVINAQDGTVVIGGNVRITPCAVATGSLSVTVKNQPLVSQPNPFGRGQTVVAVRSKVGIKTHTAHLVLMTHMATLEDVVRTLNTVGATPIQLASILEAMKAAGSLHARIKII
ncbi:flagellar basal body P-ring protein FlgI [Acidithiobacillus ferrivorans]|nr:flagellar basal body P-ring protein FlgI [Acidithiobacillus ferrivorans]